MSSTSRFARLLLAAIAAACLAMALSSVRPRAALARGRVSSSRKSVDALADDYFWALDARQSSPVLSARGNKSWVSKLEGFQSRLRRIHKGKLDQQGRITSEMLAHDLTVQKRHVTEGFIEQDLGSIDSLMLTIYNTASGGGGSSVTQWRWIIKQLRRSPRFVDQYIALLSRGLAAGRVRARGVVEASIDSMKVLSSKSVEMNAFRQLIGALEQGLAGKKQLRALRRELAAAIEVACSAHGKLGRFLKTKYLPRAPREPGRTPAEKRFYLHQMSMHLGKAHDGAKIAAIGRRAIARIRKQMEKTARQINPKMASLESFMGGLGRRSSLEFKNGKELLEQGRAEVKRARALAHKMASVGKTKLRVASVPAAEDAAVDAQYLALTDTAGEIQLNTGRLFGMISRHELANLITHEGYGGHHLQTMWAARQTALPEYRKAGGLTIFEEGWAMYSERWRAEQKGGYTPLQRIGHLQQQLWAAALLVADVELNTGKMNSAQAKRFVAKHLFARPDAVSSEIEKIVNWPAQGPTYHLGKREVLAARAEVKRLLGVHYDERAFHHKLLGMGSIPVAQMRKTMRSWARRRLAQKRRLQSRPRTRTRTRTARRR